MSTLPQMDTSLLRAITGSVMSVTEAFLDEKSAIDQRKVALDQLYGRINYERTATIPYREGGFKLDRMRELLRRLGDPQEGLKIVHVAGTKGKGSTAAMIAAMLTASGSRTGLFTSPHLERIEERFAIDGAACRAAEFVSLMQRIWPVVEAMDNDSVGPTYFEITTALALLHFSTSQVDAAVLEVGMGGRLDSTNVCQPAVSVITSISFDHTKQLGNTLEEIAREKAGIIKAGVPVVSGVLQEEPRKAIAQVAEQNDAPLIQLNHHFHFQYEPPRAGQTSPRGGTLAFQSDNADQEFRLSDLHLSLLGRHQGANAAVALATIEQLRSQGWSISQQAIREGLSATVLPARVEMVADQPITIIDSAHNVASIEALLNTIEESFPSDRRTLVFATTQDKEVQGMLKLLLPHFQQVVLTRYLNNPRAVPPQELQQLAATMTDGELYTTDDPAQAWEYVVQNVSPQGLVCVTGSFFIAAEMRKLITGSTL